MRYGQSADIVHANDALKGSKFDAFILDRFPQFFRHLVCIGQVDGGEFTGTSVGAGGDGPLARFEE